MKRSSEYYEAEAASLLEYADSLKYNAAHQQVAIAAAQANASLAIAAALVENGASS